MAEELPCDDVLIPLDQRNVVSRPCAEATAQTWSNMSDKVHLLASSFRLRQFLRHEGDLPTLIGHVSQEVPVLRVAGVCVEGDDPYVVLLIQDAVGSAPLLDLRLLLRR